jgi:hypothetical protein
MLNCVDNEKNRLKNFSWHYSAFRLENGEQSVSQPRFKLGTALANLPCTLGYEFKFLFNMGFCVLFPSFIPALSLACP